MANATVIKHNEVVTKMSAKNDTFISEAKAIAIAVAKIINFPTYPTTSTSDSVFTGHITDMFNAQAGLKTKPKTSTPDLRNTARKLVAEDIEYIRLGVQVLVNGNAAQAAVIAGNASMFIKTNKPHGSRSDAAGHGTVESTIVLDGAGAGPHQWQRSPDSITWTDLPPTRTGTTQMENIASGTVFYTRNRTVLAKGQYGAWSNPIKVSVSY